MEGNNEVHTHTHTSRQHVPHTLLNGFPTETQLFDAEAETDGLNEAVDRLSLELRIAEARAGAASQAQEHMQVSIGCWLLFAAAQPSQ